MKISLEILILRNFLLYEKYPKACQAEANRSKPWMMREEDVCNLCGFNSISITLRDILGMRRGCIEDKKEKH